MKSHFRFSKKQRNGIFLLVLIVVGLQVWSFVLNNRSAKQYFDNPELQEWRREVDSLTALKEAESQFKLYPFNPNYISDYKGYTLGMTLEQIDALHAFRAQNKWINSKQEFQKITGVSKEWMDSIGPYFKFPERISKERPNSYNNDAFSIPKTYEDKYDLNKATARQLEGIYGIGPTLSKRIIEYRSKFDGGFADDIELTEIYGLKDSTITRLLNYFTVKTPRDLVKFNINSASRDQLVQIPYIDYELAFNIIEYRTLHEGIKGIEELTKIEDFPEKKINLIGLYLQF